MKIMNFVRSTFALSAAAMLALCSCSSDKPKPSDNKEYDYVFEVSEGLEIPTPERVGVYTFEQVHTPRELLDDFLKQYISEDEIPNGNITEITGQPNGVLWENETQAADIAFNGYFVYDEQHSKVDSSIEQDVIAGREPDLSEEYYYVQDFDKTTIELDGKSKKLSELAEESEQYLEDACKALKCDVKVKPIYAVYHFYNKEPYAVELMFCIDNGDGSGINIFRELNKPEEESSYFTFYSGYNSFDDIPEIQNYRGIIKPIDFEEKTDYISCEEAMQIASDTLAENIGFTLHYVQLEYRPKVTEYDEYQWDKENPRFEYQYGAKYVSDPYWALYFDVTDNYQRVVYVNALTGDVDLLFNN